MEEYRLRRAESEADCERLRELFDAIFHPEQVGLLAQTLCHHFPGLEPRHWFVAQQHASGELVAGFALIPWTWQMEGVRLKTAEMGIVGTSAPHRRRGLMRALNREFDRALAEEGFHLAFIQGIPGFYQRFGFHYALPLENHINLDLRLIPPADGAGRYRLATTADIPTLLRADKVYRQSYSVTTVRDEAHWTYLLTHTQRSGFGSQFWLSETGTAGKPHYFRIHEKGFGSGLIVSEVSEDASPASLASVLSCCRQLAAERALPYVRLNLHGDSAAGRLAVAMGAAPGLPYGWQVKVPDPVALLRRITPVLDRRLQGSPCAGFTGLLRLDLYGGQADLSFDRGHLTWGEAVPPQERHTLAVPADLLPPLLLGYQGWRKLRDVRPDLGPRSALAALLADALFPPCRSWIYQPY